MRGVFKRRTTVIGVMFICGITLASMILTFSHIPRLRKSDILRADLTPKTNTTAVSIAAKKRHMSPVEILQEAIDEQDAIQAYLGLTGSQTDRKDLRERTSSLDQVCRIPARGPNSRYIKPFIRHPEPLECPQVQPELTYMESDGSITLNVTTYTRLKADATKESLRCEWRHCTGNRSKEDQTGFQELNKNHIVPLPGGAVQVQCTQDGDVVYKNVYYSHELRRNVTLFSSSPENPSVVILPLQSVSYGAFRRNMPLAYTYLTKQLNTFVFRAFNRLDDRSMRSPFEAAFFSEPYGKGNTSRGGSNATDSSSHPDGATNPDRFTDNFIGKLFSDNGYLTALIEDRPASGHTTGLGLRNCMDWDYAPKLDLRKDFRLPAETDSFCYDGRPIFAKNLEMMENFMISQTKDRYILIAPLFHMLGAQPEDCERGDNIIVDFLERMTEEGYLDNVVLLIMSDHGASVGPIRNTPTGANEESLPYASITVPVGFKDRYYELMLNMKNNYRRLATHRDIYETLLDIATGRFSENQRSTRTGAYSLLYEIPLSRSCVDAGVPYYYCGCLKVIRESGSSVRAQYLASDLVRYVNRKMRTADGKCAYYELGEIYRLEQVTDENGGNIIGDDQNGGYFRVAISVSPGNATLEGIFVSPIPDADAAPSLVKRIDNTERRTNCLERSQYDTETWGHLSSLCYCG